MRTMWIATMLAVGLAGWSQTSPAARYVIGPEQAAAALSTAAMRIEAGQVELLAHVSSAEPNPQLDVLSVSPAHSVEDGRTESFVMLSCRMRSSCLPFYVLVKGEAGALESLAVAGRIQSGSAVKKQAIMMRAGAHATLRLDSPRAQINLAVVSLESGSMGSRIRVATLDRKEVYVGEIVGPNSLRGSF